MPDADQPQPMPLPSPELIERARAFRDAGATPAAAKSSATVVLMRDNARGIGANRLEVFMLRRRAAMAFAGGMHVFPGGVVDPGDGGQSIDDPIVAAAIRETFEETGLLLAVGDTAEAAATVDAAAFEYDRLALIDHRTVLESVLARHHLAARPDWLRPWSRWITPDFEPRRYDTHFFVALAPEGQDARDTGGESDAAEWVAPGEALAAAARRDWLLMPPTEVTLRELAEFSTAAEVFEAAAGRIVQALHAAIDLDADPPVFVFRTTT